MFKFNEQFEMSSLQNLNKRIEYRGGDAQRRMIKDKSVSLKKALLYSYQAETAILEDGRQFRCLINPDKLTVDYDTKMISIPFEDENLLTHQLQPIGLKCGDIFTWKQTDTHWLVFLQYLQESANAYFRAQIRRCDDQIEIGDNKYWAYIRGPLETSIQWNQKGGVEWNDLNYSLAAYVPARAQILELLHRFTVVKITEPYTGKSKSWQVVATNPYYGDGMISIALDEFFENSIKDAVAAEKATEQPQIDKDWQPYISGPAQVKSYDRVTYSIMNGDNIVTFPCSCCPTALQEQTNEFYWEVTYNDGEKQVVKKYEDSPSIVLDVLMKKGSFTIAYKNKDTTIAALKVIVSLY